MNKEKLNWEEILIKQNFSSGTNYIFENGCIVVKSFSRNSFICFNKLTNSLVNANEYFKCEELNSDKNSAINLYSNNDGPRFRITNIIGNESVSINEESFFFFGGIIAYNKDINIYLDDLWKFELSLNSFKKLTIPGDKICSRGGHTLTFYKDKNAFYLFGGKSESERFNDLYEIDITKNKISKLESLTNSPISRINHTATICKNSLYIFGGWDGTKTLNDMYELSLDTFIWYSISYKGDLSPPPVYRHTAAGFLSDRIVIFGGVNEHSQKFNELFMFDVTSHKWKILPVSGSYPAPRTFHSMCSSGESLYIFGGFSKLANNDCYSITLPEITNDKINSAEHSNIFFYEEKILNESISHNNSTANNIDILTRQVKELKQRYENEVIKNICKICFEREINTVILDCCHRFVCYDCSFKCDDKCPLCKRGIKEILKTYN